MQCPRCHADNRAGRKFCAAGGQALAFPCPRCAFVNDADDRFCGGCGQRAVGICQEADLPVLFPFYATALGVAYTMTGRVADTVPLLTQAMKQVTAAERVDLQALCGLSLGEVQVLASRLEEALTLAELALALARDHQERGHQAYALRLFGDIAARRKPPQSALAEAYYQQALTPEQARTELSAAIALYRVMDMTFWLPQAEAALVQVA